MTRISVILPVYDAQPFVSFCVDSLLEQTHRDIRVIAIDEGSTDGSGAILWAAATLDRRITVISRGNKGLIATLNQGLALADSDLVARMDADDIAFPDRFAAQRDMFAARGDLGLLDTNFTTLFTPTRIAPAPAPLLAKRGERAILGRFCTPLRHPTVIFRRSALGAAGLAHDAAYPFAKDFDLFRRLARTTAIAETVAPHLAYRLHTGSFTVTRSVQMAQTHLRKLEENPCRHYPQAAGTGVDLLAASPMPQGSMPRPPLCGGWTPWPRISPMPGARPMTRGSATRCISFSPGCAAAGPMLWPIASSRGPTDGGRSVGASGLSWRHRSPRWGWPCLTGWSGCNACAGRAFCNTICPDMPRLHKGRA